MSDDTKVFLVIFILVCITFGVAFVLGGMMEKRNNMAKFLMAKGKTATYVDVWVRWDGEAGGSGCRIWR